MSKLQIGMRLVAVHDVEPYTDEDGMQHGTCTAHFLLDSPDPQLSHSVAVDITGLFAHDIEGWRAGQQFSIDITPVAQLLR